MSQCASLGHGVRSTLGWGMGFPGRRELVVSGLALLVSYVLASAVAAQPKAPPSDDTRVLVTRFVVTGVSAFTPEQLRPLLADSASWQASDE